MPVSKSKRKKKVRTHGVRRGVSAIGFEESLLLGEPIAKELDTEAAIAGLKIAGQGFTPEKLREAQDLAYDAWESDRYVDRLDLATRALTLCPWCGDAYGILATAAPHGSDITVHLWRMTVAAAEFSLKAEMGEDVFERCAGDFWGLLETRPYMRARAGLSQALWDFGERAAAVAVDLDCLRLNPNDNQGARYVVAARLLQLDQGKELDKLLEAYADEDMAHLHFTRAARAFQREGDSERSRRILSEALTINPHAAIYLLGRRQLPDESPAMYGEGSLEEAILYTEMAREAWKSVPGALTWLAQQVRLVKLPR